jgi:hypothetical protein
VTAITIRSFSWITGNLPKVRLHPLAPARHGDLNDDLRPAAAGHVGLRKILSWSLLSLFDRGAQCFDQPQIMRFSKALA